MDIQFSCQCGEQVSDTTRSEGEMVSANMRCEECGAVYAVTISRLGSLSD